ncbi:MAG: hypothetical protein HWE25_01120 [Alphaproteobacteria bacterium]|nr:hypothetical protein [Alphaproteobacteria bacterium]
MFKKFGSLLFLAVGAITLLAITASAKDVSTIKLSTPIPADGMVMTPEGDLLVAAAWDGSTVNKIDLPMGTISRFTDGLAGPIALTFGKNGDLYASNWRGSTISLIGEGRPPVDWAEVGPKGDALALDSVGNIWITVGSANAIKRVSPDGVVSTVAEGGILKYPLGLALREDDTAFVGGGQSGEIYKVTSDGQVSLFAQVPGAGEWKIGHLLYAGGRLFASGLQSNQIFEIGMDGTVTVLAGSGKEGHEDGNTADATFSFPVSLSVSGDGKYLYVLAGGKPTDALRRIEL